MPTTLLPEARPHRRSTLDRFKAARLRTKRAVLPKHGRSIRAKLADRSRSRAMQRGNLAGRIAGLAASCETPATLVDGTVCKHAPAYIAAVLETAAYVAEEVGTSEPRAPREFAQHFLARDPQETASPVGLAAVLFEAYLIQNEETLYGQFLETYVEPGDKTFLAIFEGPIARDQLVRLTESVKGFVESLVLVRYGDHSEHEVSDLTVLECTPLKEGLAALGQTAKPPAGDGLAQPPALTKGDMHRQAEPARAPVGPFEALRPQTMADYRAAAQTGLRAQVFETIFGVPEVRPMPKSTGLVCEDPNGVAWTSPDQGRTWTPNLASAEDVLTEATFAVGDVVHLAGKSRRYVLLSRDQFGRFHLVALSGGDAGSAPTGVGPEEIERDRDQTRTFTGKEAVRLRQKFQRYQQTYRGLANHTTFRDDIPLGESLTEADAPSRLRARVLRTLQHGRFAIANPTEGPEDPTRSTVQRERKQGVEGAGATLEVCDRDDVVCVKQRDGKPTAFAHCRKTLEQAGYDVSDTRHDPHDRPYVYVYEALHEEPVPHDSTDLLTALRRIVQTQQAGRVPDPQTGKGMMLDLFSASTLLALYDALSPSSRQKLLAFTLPKMVDVAFKTVKRAQAKTSTEAAFTDLCTPLTEARGLKATDPAQQHQERIARKTLRMPAPMRGVMGGPSREQAQAILTRLGYTDAEIARLAEHDTALDALADAGLPVLRQPKPDATAVPGHQTPAALAEATPTPRRVPEPSEIEDFALAYLRGGPATLGDIAVYVHPDLPLRDVEQALKDLRHDGRVTKVGRQWALREALDGTPPAGPVGHARTPWTPPGAPTPTTPSYVYTSAGRPAPTETDAALSALRAEGMLPPSSDTLSPPVEAMLHVVKIARVKQPDGTTRERVLREDEESAAQLAAGLSDLRPYRVQGFRVTSEEEFHARMETDGAEAAPPEEEDDGTVFTDYHVWLDQSDTYALAGQIVDFPDGATEFRIFGEEPGAYYAESVDEDLWTAEFVHPGGQAHVRFKAATRDSAEAQARRYARAKRTPGYRFARLVGGSQRVESVTEAADAKTINKTGPSDYTAYQGRQAIAAAMTLVALKAKLQAMGEDPRTYTQQRRTLARVGMPEARVGDIGSPGWQQATPVQRAQWLRNQIAFAKDHPETGGGQGLQAYHVRRWEKHLARIEKSLGPVTEAGEDWWVLHQDAKTKTWTMAGPYDERTAKGVEADKARVVQAASRAEAQTKAEPLLRRLGGHWLRRESVGEASRLGGSQTPAARAMHVADLKWHIARLEREYEARKAAKPGDTAILARMQQRIDQERAALRTIESVGEAVTVRVRSAGRIDTVPGAVVGVTKDGDVLVFRQSDYDSRGTVSGPTAKVGTGDDTFQALHVSYNPGFTMSRAQHDAIRKKAATLFRALPESADEAERTLTRATAKYRMYLPPHLLPEELTNNRAVALRWLKANPTGFVIDRKTGEKITESDGDTLTEPPADFRPTPTLTPASVDYTDGPVETQACEACTHFTAEGCTLVQEAFAPKGHCARWAGAGTVVTEAEWVATFQRATGPGGGGPATEYLGFTGSKTVATKAAKAEARRRDWAFGDLWLPSEVSAEARKKAGFAV